MVKKNNGEHGEIEGKVNFFLVVGDENVLIFFTENILSLLAAN